MSKLNNLVFALGVVLLIVLAYCISMSMLDGEIRFGILLLAIVMIVVGWNKLIKF